MGSAVALECSRYRYFAVSERKKLSMVSSRAPTQTRLMLYSGSSGTSGRQPSLCLRQDKQKAAAKSAELYYAQCVLTGCARTCTMGGGLETISSSLTDNLQHGTPHMSHLYPSEDLLTATDKRSHLMPHQLSKQSRSAAYFSQQECSETFDLRI